MHQLQICLAVQAQSESAKVKLTFLQLYLKEQKLLEDSTIKRLFQEVCYLYFICLNDNCDMYLAANYLRHMKYSFYITVYFTGAVQKKQVNKETNTDLAEFSPDTVQKLFRPPLSNVCGVSSLFYAICGYT